MSTEAESILNQALNLSADDRSVLAVQLFDSLTPAENLADVATAWDEEIGRRLSDADAGATSGVPWEQVRARLGM